MLSVKLESISLNQTYLENGCLKAQETVDPQKLAVLA